MQREEMRLPVCELSCETAYSAACMCLCVHVYLVRITARIYDLPLVGFSAMNAVIVLATRAEETSSRVTDSHEDDDSE